MRTCKNCNERKTLKSFRKDTKAPSRRSHFCRACENALRAEAEEATNHFDPMAEMETRNVDIEDVQ